MKTFEELKEKLLSDKKALILIAVFFIGLILFALSGINTDKTKTVSDKSDGIRETIEKELEQRAEKLLSSVEGVGKVKILVTVESINEVLYAKDEQTDENEGKYSGEYVLIDESGKKSGLKIKSVSPVIKGVAVSCEGGGSAKVRSEVTSLICAAFGINANRVYVSKYGQ
ncbi:MAG: hypothetical protein J1E34_07810 [Oscillospiraceae bacterium]|nr:hypothetical protein [Oscillospiraceae bacterium]